MAAYPMKPLYLLLIVGLFLAGFAKAQSRPSTSSPKATTTSATSAKPGATRVGSQATGPVSATTVSNRQQELYDQYHGITKKPAPATASPTPVATQAPSKPATKPTPVSPRANPVATSASTEASAPEKPAFSSGNSRLRIGVRGGVTYPFYLEKQTGIDPRPGFVGGFVMQVGRGTFSFQPEINYSRITSKSTDVGFGSTTASVDQVVVPLFLKISSGTFAGNRFFLNIGPYASYLTSSSINGVIREIDSSVGRFSFGAAAGVGVMLKAGPGHVTVEARGLYTLGDNNNGFATDTKTIFGEGTIGYVVPLGR